MIRKYQSSDIDDLLSVWAAASAVAHPFLSEDFLASERQNIPNVYLPIAETWVWEKAAASNDAHVVGFIALLGNEVGALFVDPKYHGQGFGLALMNHVRELRDELEVDVFKANAIGRAFYKKYGFQQFEEKVHEQTGQIVFRLKLLAN